MYDERVIKTNSHGQSKESTSKGERGPFLNAHPQETTKQFFDRKVYYDKLNRRCAPSACRRKAIFGKLRNFREGKLHFDGVNYNDVTMETFSLNYTHFTSVSMSCGKMIFSLLCLCALRCPLPHSLVDKCGWKFAHKILINFQCCHGLPIINILSTVEFLSMATMIAN